jgi:hypothetical protein
MIVTASVRRRLTDVQRHAHPQRSGLRPAFVGKCSLGGYSSAKCICGCDESRLDRVTEVLIEEAVVILNR